MQALSAAINVPVDWQNGRAAQFRKVIDVRSEWTPAPAHHDPKVLDLCAARRLGPARSLLRASLSCLFAASCLMPCIREQRLSISEPSR